MIQLNMLNELNPGPGVDEADLKFLVIGFYGQSPNTKSAGMPENHEWFGLKSSWVALTGNPAALASHPYIGAKEFEAKADVDAWLQTSEGKTFAQHAVFMIVTNVWR